jgi:hypothetical protein
MKSVPKSIIDHPYVSYADREGLFAPSWLASGVGFHHMSKFCDDLLSEHQRRPIDAIVGDDVSGRVPTLIAHRLFRQALVGGYVDSVPRTLFMTSGRLDSIPRNSKDEIDNKWSENLRAHVGLIIGAMTVRRAMVLTEVVGTGRSVSRITEAFRSNGVEDTDYAVSGEALYLCGHGSSNIDRRIVGVEKYPPEPVSRRHADFDGIESAKLRHFLDDYASAIYDNIM